ncbi:hypothetical protein GLOIN_2v1590123 [Rhizophagus irregularis DAOM 181602=DAOM 197198]|uniref:Uncharacterized protein n=1 Tax=Rhizophagus irregularis (strain DAOM 181602 / DAOM 197198 / MUCL 43194) TaxID=747089 RepID=A0A2P4Q605_RHIID|nr:hypothetical protein GLOIN_2v1590123 [Rhizophagus irregularis DAOM 181602=DAOM 197198]POG73042.1 hypothetical protein GLOIN_2v1590123 [Rhizophagus irregularis DAOM 181602=DAOM 197198]|eukprot:XP_025179908.1 hypothetical protein GLOIN_2v1590123 [Rhizophagus irregularis DAOM 181602=DAOM 197198]
MRNVETIIIRGSKIKFFVVSHILFWLHKVHKVHKMRKGSERRTYIILNNKKKILNILLIRN